MVDEEELQESELEGRGLATGVKGGGERDNLVRRSSLG